MPKNFIYKFFLLVAMLGITASVQGEDNEREFYVFDASNGMAASGAQTIKCTKTGRLIITTIGQVNLYNGYSFAHIDPKPSDFYPLAGYNGHYRLMFDRYNRLWLKDKQQVICANLTMEEIIHDVGNVFHEMGIDKPVDNLFADKDSYLWLLTDGRLVSKGRAKTLPVRSGIELHDVDVYDNHYVLQFYADGLVSIFDLKTGKRVGNISAGAEAEQYEESSVIYPYEDGYFQIRNGEKGAVLRRLDMKTRQWTQVLDLPYHLNNMVAHKGILYIAAEHGYWTYDLTTGEKEHIETLKLTKGRELNTGVNVMEFDRQGGLWIGTENRGLLYAKPFNSPIKTYSWNNPESTHYYQLMAAKLGHKQKSYPRQVNCIYKDSRGWTWTATYTGLYLQRNDGTPRCRYGDKAGFRNEMIHSVVEDKNHDIWASTSFGISHLYIKGDSVTRIETYIHHDNVPNEAFVNDMAARLDDGRIVMQSLDHMVVFDPSAFHSLTSDEFTLYPKLMDLRCNGQDVETGKEYDGRVIIDRAVSRVEVIHANYDQNTMRLTFSALNYFRPMQTYYRIRIKGLAPYNNWRVFSHGTTPQDVDKNGMLYLMLINMMPGEYKMEVQASQSPDNWTQEPYVWTIMIHQPWWRSTGIYLLLAIIVFGLLLANFILFNRNTKMRMMRNNGEDDILRRIKNFVSRCDSMSSEVLSPYTMSQNGEEAEGHIGQLDEEFMEVMLKVIPYVNGLKEQPFTMSDLADMLNTETSKLYELLAANQDKNPRQLIGRLRLQEAARLLTTTDMTIEKIADQCHYVSPNYFIASFYHHYRTTPQDYRKSNAR
ncbi:MAG: helix-turn-helix domain-containing protein [Prevotella sp.]|nr:helix-turn-helix domain-containing protein [Prevotella sp.]